MKRRLGIVLVAMVTVFGTAGCISGKILIGRELEPTAIEKLAIGQSTPQDVLGLLGEPFGKGRSYLPIDSGPRTLWVYVYSESTLEENNLTDVRRTELWVYFDRDRYDGYLWFSSFPVNLSSERPAR